MDAGGGGDFPLSWVIRNHTKGPAQNCGQPPSLPGSHLARWSPALEQSLGLWAQRGGQEEAQGPATGPWITGPLPGLPQLPDGMVEAQEPQGPRGLGSSGPQGPGSPPHRLDTMVPSRPVQGPHLLTASLLLSFACLPRLLHYFTPTSRPWFSSEGWKRRR